MPHNPTSEFTAEFEQARTVKHFLNELDLGIRAANLEIIHGRIPDLDRDKAFVFATMVARLRADYLEAAFRHCTQHAHPAEQDIEELRAKRLAYEEARDAFQALRHAIESGYIDVAQMDRADGKAAAE